MCIVQSKLRNEINHNSVTDNGVYYQYVSQATEPSPFIEDTADAHTDLRDYITCKLCFSC